MKRFLAVLSLTAAVLSFVPEPLVAHTRPEPGLSAEAVWVVLLPLALYFTLRESNC